MNLSLWAKRWRVADAALMELQELFGISIKHTGVQNKDYLSEAAIQSTVRLEASEKGMRLWRNNVGATYTKEGSFIRYGLANESKELNNRIKSADLIGVRPILITKQWIGCTIGQFVSREIKASNWKYSGGLREEAQLRWAELIMSLGGDACFANKEGTL